RLIERNHRKVLLDAGAFQAFQLKDLKSPTDWVWTPHPGEMAELLGWDTGRVERDRFKAAAQAQNRLGGQFVLKGHQPVLKVKGGNWWCWPYGDDRLGKGGTGDILSGLVGGLMTQMENTAQATALAVYLHAYSADFVTQGR